MTKFFFRIITGTLILLNLVSCVKRQKENCRQDSEFICNFQNCIQIISLRNSGYVTEYRHAADAYMCLKVLTGHDSAIDTSSDTPLFYPYNKDKDYFVDDFIAWSKWFEANKCRVNITFADSVFQSNGTREDSIKWPPLVFELVTKETKGNE